jgi:hypothetical protein
VWLYDWLGVTVLVWSRLITAALVSAELASKQIRISKGTAAFPNTAEEGTLEPRTFGPCRPPSKWAYLTRMFFSFR